ncbi:glycoside hydrolase family 128 protein [Ceratobasidium sp. AG-Ba]|nr:glycoside hydrolase family 128 protein [Ceratobasidium sp. AG-Ba]
MLPSLSLAFSLAAICQAGVIQRRQNPNNTTAPALNKTGLAWGGGDADITQFESPKVSWYYTWGPNNNWVQGKSDLEYVPMFWGPKNQDSFTGLVNQETIASQGIKHVLGMNEPEQVGQSNLTAAEAVQWWQTYLEPLRQYGVSLGSPAMSAATRSKQWLLDFATACAPVGGCNYDFLALHWYGINTTKFITYLEDMHETFPDKPIWLTEFACHNFQDGGEQCTYADAVAFLNTTQAWLDEQDYIHRYAWFGAMKDPVITPVNALMDQSGIINDLGKQYIGAMAAPANPTQKSSSGGSVKINGDLLIGSPTMTTMVAAGILAGAILVLA